MRRGPSIWGQDICYQVCVGVQQSGGRISVIRYASGSSNLGAGYLLSGMRRGPAIWGQDICYQVCVGVHQSGGRISVIRYA